MLCDKTSLYSFFFPSAGDPALLEFGRDAYRFEVEFEKKGVLPALLQGEIILRQEYLRGGVDCRSRMPFSVSVRSVVSIVYESSSLNVLAGISCGSSIR